jgi:hypothetical protein
MHPFDTAPPGDRADLLCGLLDRRAIRPDRLRGHSIMKDSSPSYPCGDYTSDAPILPSRCPRPTCPKTRYLGHIRRGPPHQSQIFFF